MHDVMRPHRTTTLRQTVCRIAILSAFLCATPCMAHNNGAEGTKQALHQLGAPFFEGNQVELLPGGQVFFDDFFRHIKQAKRYIHIEFYKIYNDSIGQATLHLLRQKVRQGVQVRIIVDGFANHGHKAVFTKAHRQQLAAEGIHMVEFSPFRFPYIHGAYHRDHRKIVTIDGETAYTGGLNIADYYIHGKPEIGHWADMHIRLHGPCVAEYERQFETFWHKCTGETLNPTQYTGQDISTGHITTAIVARHPGKHSGIMRKAYAAAIHNATHTIRIVNAYPTLTHTVRRALYRALERGVKVEVMLSANNDQPLTPLLMAQQMRRLMERGAEIYYYEGGFHHAKVMICDNNYCTIGTANLDARSLMWDYEINAFLFDPNITSRLIDIYEFDKRSRCQRLTPQGFRTRFTPCQRTSGKLLFPINGFL